MLSDEQRDAVLDAYDKKYGFKGPRDDYGFPLASYRWHGFLTAYETLLPVIAAANAMVAQWEQGSDAMEVIGNFGEVKREAGL